MFEEAVSVTLLLAHDKVPDEAMLAVGAAAGGLTVALAVAVQLLSGSVMVTVNVPELVTVFAALVPPLLQA